MKTHLTSIIFYIYKNYPSRRELSKVRLIGMLYLVDWKYSLQHGSQLTGIEWSIDDKGPHPDSQALKLIENNFQCLMNMGHIPSSKATVEPRAVEIINFVIGTSASLDLSEFIRLIYSTYPVIAQRQTEKPDLGESAKRYRSIKPLLLEDQEIQ